MNNLNKLDIRVIQYWKWSSLPILSVLISLAIIFIQQKFFSTWPNIITWGAVLYIIYTTTRYLLFIVRGAKVKYERHGYLVTDEDIENVEGTLFSQTRTLVPFNRIQHVSLSQSFWERKYGIHTLWITTAGSHHEIPGLDGAESHRLYTLLGQYTKVEDGEMYGD